MVGKIEFENKIYEFTWTGILMFVILAPAIAFGVYYSNDYVWLHGITVRITNWSLNLITGLENELHYELGYEGGPWFFLIQNNDRTGFLGWIHFETFCTGVQAIAIFMGVILATPHSLDKNTSKDIWKRKIWATIACSLLFYVVNIMRMWLQLYLYHIGYAWEDIHYSISAASSFVAVIAILLLHKICPEFIMAILWTMDQVRAKVKAAKGWDAHVQDQAKSAVTENQINETVPETITSPTQIKSDVQLDNPSESKKE